MLKRNSKTLLNLVVKDALAELDDSVRRVRLVCKFVKSSPSRQAAFKRACETYFIDTRGNVKMDVATRWNSTYDMLVAAVKYTDALKALINDDTCIAGLLKMLDNDLPLDVDWERIKVFVQIFQLYYDATRVFSASKRPTSHLFFAQISRICKSLDAMSESDDEFISDMAMRMQRKFDSYWGELQITNPKRKINEFLFVATVLDPINKLEWFEFWFTRLWRKDPDKNKAKKELAKVREIVQKVYDEYNHLPPLTDAQLPTTPAVVSIPAIPEEANAHLDHMTDQEFEAYMETRERSEDINELERYFKEPREPNSANFNILTWWKMHERKFPVLARMARDILAIPLSTVSSESAFSTGGRVIGPHRSSLLPSTVEGLICAQNWLLSTGLIEDFAALSLEDTEDDPEMLALELGIQTDPDSIIKSLASLRV